MLTAEEIVPLLDSTLADQAVFISKLQAIAPGSIERRAIKELEQEILPSFDALKQLIPAIAEGKPSPAIIGDRLKDALHNMMAILELLTALYDDAPGSKLPPIESN